MTQPVFEGYLYRLYDQNGRLLYVGVTVWPERRMKQHQQTKAWWGEVAKIKIRPHLRYTVAREAEVRAIRFEAPKYNIQRFRELPLASLSRGHAPPGPRLGQLGHSIVVCPWCGRSVGQRVDGATKWHYSSAGSTEVCGGSNRPRSARMCQQACPVTAVLERTDFVAPAHIHKPPAQKGKNG